MELQTTQPVAPSFSQRETQMMDVAKSLEAAFLSEMLAAAGIGQTPEAFGGGAGEDQFASFLRDEQAKQMTEAGGIGLAQSLFDAMIAKSHE
jgi:Rod binding domain-containing protein